MAYVEASVRRTQFIAAARAALAAHGVAKTSLRVVAAEAGVPLATMQYVFPSKAELLRAVVEDVVEEISSVLADAAATSHGLEHAIRQGLHSFWERLVDGGRDLQMLQYELTMYSLRTPGQEQLARRQYERYAGVVADWCRQSVTEEDDVDAAAFDHVARLIVAGVDGLILQHLCDPDEARARRELDSLAQMTTRLVGRSAPSGSTTVDS